MKNDKFFRRDLYKVGGLELDDTAAVEKLK